MRRKAKRRASVVEQAQEGLTPDGRAAGGSDAGEGLAGGGHAGAALDLYNLCRPGSGPAARVGAAGIGRAVLQLRNRHAAMSWWRQAMSKFPGGMVPMATVRVILGVTASRVRSLVSAGKLRVVAGCPGMEDFQWVPADDLIAAPFSLATGRRGLYGLQRVKSPVIRLVLSDRRPARGKEGRWIRDASTVAPKNRESTPETGKSDGNK